MMLNDAFVSINGVDLSAFVKQVRLDYNAAALDDTVMGDATKSSVGGLKEWSGQVDFLDDYGASAPDVSLFSIVGTVVTVIIRPDKSDGVGATNPNYTGSALLTSFMPVSGSVGELATTTLSFVSAGTLSRATS